MGADERSALVSTPEVMAHALGFRPLYIVESPTGEGLAAAKWRFRTFHDVREEYPHTVLAYRTAGSGYVTKRYGPNAIRKRPKIGSVTFCVGDGRSVCTLEGPAEALHLYVRRELFARFAEEHLSGGTLPRVDDFFAIEDPWLDGYFRMLASELEGGDGLERPIDSLLLGQTEHLVVQHLVRWHSNAPARELHALEAQAKVNPLRPALLRRVEEHVRANLAGELSLGSLAGVCCMSADHFLRSFRAAAGVTPYHYVLEQRLRKASALVKGGTIPIAAIAAQCGFGSPSHFSVKFRARFGVAPSLYRRDA
jgi:AraC family transcriptional regulator